MKNMNCYMMMIKRFIILKRNYIAVNDNRHNNNYDNNDNDNNNNDNNDNNDNDNNNK